MADLSPDAGEREPLLSKKRANVRRPSAVSFLLGEQDDEPREEIFWWTASQYLLELFSIARLSVLAIVLTLSILGYTLLPEQTFTYHAGEGLAVLTQSSCQYQCESTHYDPVARERFGGVGLCKNSAGERLAVFKVCDPEKPSVCEEAPSKQKAGKDAWWQRNWLTKCSFQVLVPRWEPYFVFSVVCFTTMLVIENMPAEICLLLACCLLAAAGIITPAEAFDGIANTAVVAIAFMFPIAAALEETGVVNKVVHAVLGSSTDLLIAIPRLYAAVTVFSGFLSNTGIAAMMIPIIVSWSRRLNCHPGKLLLNLSYFCQLGGSLTLIGSSCTLVAAQSVRKRYVMGMFDLLPMGLCVGMVTCIVCTLLTPTSMLKSSACSEADIEDAKDIASSDTSSNAESPCAPGLYKAYFVVRPESVLEGREAKLLEEDLSCIAGVSSIQLELSCGERQIVASGDVVIASAEAQGIVGIRRVEGLEPMSQTALSRLEGGRRSRRLYEGSVGSSSALESLDAEKLRDQFQMALVASRGPDGRVPWTPRDGGHVKEGDVLLFEASVQNIVRLKQLYDRSFLLLRAVPLSEPPRRDKWYDPVRTVFVLIVFALFVTLVSEGYVALHWGAGLVVAIFFIARALSIEQFYRSINGRVLLVVGCAFGVAKAVEKAGLAHFLADKSLAIAGPYGTYGIAAAVYVVAAALGLVINNAAICAMIGPMLVAMSDKDPSLDLRALTWVLAAGAGACFLSPLGYQTNMMVMVEGEPYSILGSHSEQFI
eukprot:TRINITY_DN19194_c0_g1_i2.p1 TRINITY_DN19194_c0_g1~~TRINITY_DN19194_c0_g1_i2.p1  ORF type:complete len:793 (+),score=143.84 TRINITY_DN19194_c0_g1_i2:83-2380(+)